MLEKFIDIWNLSPKLGVHYTLVHFNLGKHEENIGNSHVASYHVHPFGFEMNLEYFHAFLIFGVNRLIFFLRRDILTENHQFKRLYLGVACFSHKPHPLNLVVLFLQVRA